MAKKEKIKRPAAQAPKGFRDVDPAEIRGVEAMLGEIRKVYERYGFEPIETPFVEYTEALGKFLPDEDRPNQGIFSFQDDDERWLSLRYDLTAPLARYVAENFQDLPKPYRSYRSGYVFRNEKPGPGRFRQFMQMDADTVGASSVAADAEMCMMAADTMEALGFERGQYVIRVNNRKVLDGVMEAIGVSDDAQKLAVLRSIDKLDKFGVEGVRLLLGPGRKDESGDFTKGAGLSNEQVEFVCQYIEFAQEGLESTTNFLDRIEDQNIEWDTSAIVEAYSELEQMAQLVKAGGFGTDRIHIDPTVVRGLEYYTGPVYEAEVTIPVEDEKGRPVRFGSVGGGGRYDGLVSRFISQPVPATGFSVGVSRLYTALKLLGKTKTDQQAGPVVIAVMDRDRMADYQQMAADLRAENIRAEVFLGNPKNVGKQFQYADQRNSPCVIIEGSDERERGVLQVKDLAAGAAAAAAIDSHEQWKEERPGQFEIPRDDLVKEVKALLAKQERGDG